MNGTDPILGLSEARELEARLFGRDEARAWAAMQRAGRAVAGALDSDLREIGGWPCAGGRVLVLVGKGHNGGDALLAAKGLLEQYAKAQAEIIFVFGERALRPLAARAWRELVQAAGPRARRASVKEIARTARTAGYDVCLDGVFGFQFQPPLPAAAAALFTSIESIRIRLRAAVDLPSGLTDTTAAADRTFCADFTYATGSVKAPLVNGLHAHRVGRLRYIDLGFFEADAPGRLRITTPRILAPLARLRSPESDKRAYGHIFILGGSRSYPGAVLMTVLGALRSGAGLLTAFVPESLVPAYAARAPEAMWVGWPETPSGGLALEGEHLLHERLERANALVIGPGLAREPETMTLIQDIVSRSPVPLVLDADALQPAIVRAGAARRILTPHLGELRRILEGDDFYQTPAGRDAVVVVKGRLTCVTTEGGRTGCYSSFGGPVLARGGSGDILAGITGTQLAQAPADPLAAAVRAVAWHGLAADRLARERGQVAVQTTELLDHLGPALRAASEGGAD